MNLDEAWSLAMRSFIASPRWCGRVCPAGPTICERHAQARAGGGLPRGLYVVSGRRVPSGREHGEGVSARSGSILALAGQPPPGAACRAGLVGLSGVAAGGRKAGADERGPASDFAQDVLPLLAARRGAAGERGRADRQPQALGARAARAFAGADRAAIRGPTAL